MGVIFHGSEKLWRNSMLDEGNAIQEGNASMQRFYSSSSESGPSSSKRFRLSSSISRYVLQLRSRNATMINMPPTMDPMDSGWPQSIQSTMATRNIVRRAATDERTGDVRDIRTRKEPENAVGNVVSILVEKRVSDLKNSGCHLLALDKTEIMRNQKASPRGHSNTSSPEIWRSGKGIQRTSKVNKPMKLA